MPVQAILSRLRRKSGAAVRDASIAAADREAAIQKQLADSLTVRERSYLSIDPLAYACRTRCPALILHGANDLHVPVRWAERLAWAMRAGGNRDVTVRLFPGVSHSLLYDPIGLNTGWVYGPAFSSAPNCCGPQWISSRCALPCPLRTIERLRREKTGGSE